MLANLNRNAVVHRCEYLITAFCCDATSHQKARISQSRQLRIWMAIAAEVSTTRADCLNHFIDLPSSRNSRWAHNSWSL